MDMNKRIMLTSVLWMLLFMLWGCQANKSEDKRMLKSTQAREETTVTTGIENSVQTGNETEETTPNSIEGTEEPIHTEVSLPENKGNQENVTDNRRSVYADILENIYSNQVFPDGRDYGFDDTDIAKNKFAIYDIDGDGKEELIIQYITTITAGNIELIYDMTGDSKTVREEFSEFPALKFYDNGIVEAEWSHNQGRGGEFWPYTLYQYDQETDTYVTVGMVDAWDKSLSETDFNGDAFPEEKDLNGDGILYYIMQEASYDQKTIVDMEEYKEWRDSYLGKAEQINIPYKYLTHTNISGIR